MRRNLTSIRSNETAMDENKNNLVILWRIRASKGQPTLTKYNRRQVLDPMYKMESKPLIGLVQQREKGKALHCQSSCIFVWQFFHRPFPRVLRVLRQLLSSGRLINLRSKDKYRVEMRIAVFCSVTQRRN